MATPRDVRNPNRSVGAGAGPHTFSINSPATEFDERQRGIMDGINPYDDADQHFENWSLEKQRAAYEGVARADGRIATVSENASLFLAAHPEFLDTKANGKLMDHQLRTMFGIVAYSLEQYEAAYRALRASNFLALNQQEVAKQQQAEKVAKAKNLTPVFNEEEAYNLDMAELERRARSL